jgi:hypothetical protein
MATIPIPNSQTHLDLIVIFTVLDFSGADVEQSLGVHSLFFRSVTERMIAWDDQPGSIS